MNDAMVSIEPKEIGDAEDALLARAEEYPRRPFSADPHFLAMIGELEDRGCRLAAARDDVLEADVLIDIPGCGETTMLALRIVDSPDADSGGAVRVVRQDSPSATADVAMCRVVDAQSMVSRHRSVEGRSWNRG